MKPVQTLVWKVKYFNCNSQKIEDYNILKGHYTDFVKKLKKKCANKAEFSEAMDREMRWMFWSRAEWELILEVDEDKHLWLSPWVGCREPEQARIDVTNNKDFNWQDFLATQWLYNNSVKIDVYDQLKFNWDEFINLLWHTRLKYERYDIKFSWEPLKN